MAYDLRTNFLAHGNGTDNDEPAWKDANARLLADGGGKLIVPFGKYGGLRDGTSASCFKWTAPNTVIEFDPGAELVALPAPGQLAQVATISFDAVNNVKIVGGRINGGWGAITGTTDAYDTPVAAVINGVSYNAGDRVVDGINFGNQKDPKSHAARVRGCSGIEFHGTRFDNAYGDLIWIGGYDHDNSPTTPPIPIYDVLLNECKGIIAARHGVTLTGPTHNVRIIGGSFEETLGRPLGIEDGSAEDAQFVGIKLRPWWNVGSPDKDPLRVGLLIDGAGQNYSERILVDRLDVVGVILVQRVLGLSMSRTRTVLPWGPTCKTWSPLVVRFACDKIDIDRCDFINTCIGPNTAQDAKNPGRAGIVVDRYASGTTYAHPKNVAITRCNVAVSGPSIHAVAICGGLGGLIRFEQNTYDMTKADGASNGGRAFDIFAELPGQRIRLRGESSRNATGPAFKTRFSGNPVNRIAHLDVSELYAWDDQATPTTTAVFEMGSQRYFDKADIGRVTKSLSSIDDFVGWP